MTAEGGKMLDFPATRAHAVRSWDLVPAFLRPWVSELGVDLYSSRLLPPPPGGLSGVQLARTSGFTSHRLHCGSCTFPLDLFTWRMASLSFYNCCEFLSFNGKLKTH